MTSELASVATVDADRGVWNAVLGRIGREFERKIRWIGIRGFRRRRSEGLRIVESGDLRRLRFNGLRRWTIYMCFSMER